MSVYNFGHRMVKRSSKEKPPLKAAEIYFKAAVVCPDCNHCEEVFLNSDAEVYHECNEGNVRAELPKIELPIGLLKYLVNNKLINNLEYLEKLVENQQSNGGK